MLPAMLRVETRRIILELSTAKYHSAPCRGLLQALWNISRSPVDSSTANWEQLTLRHLHHGSPHCGRAPAVRQRLVVLLAAHRPGNQFYSDNVVKDIVHDNDSEVGGFHLHTNLLKSPSIRRFTRGRTDRGRASWSLHFYNKVTWRGHEQKFLRSPYHILSELCCIVVKVPRCKRTRLCRWTGWWSQPRTSGLPTAGSCSV